MIPSKLQRIFILCFLLGQGVLLYGQDTFLDNFNTVSYSNNNGTMSYSDDWVEKQ